MRAICFYFQVHQPFRLRNYRFFDIGVDHNYYDEFQNRHIMRRVADKCYLPTNKVMLDIIREYGSSFKISYSISGTALDQFEMYTPEVIDSFRALAETGCVEFLAETYSHSLCSLKSKDEFIRQVGQQAAKIEKLFGVKPVTFRNTELIYSDGIGEMVAEMGYKTQLTEGAKHVLGWKSPNYMYCNAINPKLKLLLKNFQMSDDIAFRFSQQSWNEWPLTADKYVKWLNAVDQKQEVINLFMDYETFGEHQWPETGIFEFLKVLPSLVLKSSNYSFHTPSELSDLLQPVSAFNAPYPISWADEERDLTAWLGNELQDDAFDKLYEIEHRVKDCNEESLQRDWKYLQTSDHFYYMCTKWFSDGDVHKYFNPYNTPYEAYINFMNILSDFLIRINERCPEMPFIQQQPEEVTLEKIAADELKSVQEKDAKKTTGTVPKKLNSKKNHAAVSFDQIADIQNTLLKKVIRELEPEVLALALRGTNAEIKEKFTYNFTATYQKNYTAANKRISKPSAKEISNARKQIEELIVKHS